ncbi:establishment of cohesion [Rhipicephalus microplus]|uniref:establishment of cohesion n=1 Tax=Rhipicephalus microplus TaxID=6941 RepID=UPI0023769161
MPYEGRKSSSFYSPTNYLSPLERKRLRAIENEPKATEVTDDRASNKRSTKKTTPKRRDSAGKKTQPSSKRKRSVSDSTRTAAAKPTTRQRPALTRKASSAASEKKTVVIPLSESKRTVPVPAASSESSEPPAKKVRKFFSSGLRAPVNAAVSSSMAVATAVSWNKKFTLKFEPTVAPLKKPPTSSSLKPAKKKLLMTVPFRPPKSTAVTDTSVKSVDVALPEPELVETPGRHTTYRGGSQKHVNEVANRTARKELAVTVPFRRPQTTIATTARADLTVQQVPRKISEETRGVNVEMREKKHAERTGVPHKPLEEARAKSRTEMRDTEQAKTTTESINARTSTHGAKVDILEEMGHESSDVCEPCGRANDDDAEIHEDHYSVNKGGVPSFATEHERSVACLKTEAEQSNAAVTTPILGSSTRSFMLLDRHGSANCSLPLRRLRTDAQDTAAGRNFGERSLPLKALCPNTLDSAKGTELSKRASTPPPPEKSGCSNRQPLYPVFSTPTSNRKKIAERPQIPTSPIQMPRKRFMLRSSDPAQLIIDAGQKKFGHTTCGTCGMVYTIGDVEDEKLHAQHHRSYLSIMKFPGWKNQREVGIYPDGKVIMVSPNDPKCMLNKMNEIQRVVDRELGILVDRTAPTRAPQMYFVFVSYTKNVLGFLSAQEIKQGYRVIPSDDGNMGNSIYAETEPVPAVCGVSRIWTAPFYRRKKVASRLLDRLRMNFSFGCPLDSRKIAFSDPTLMGRELAAAYTRNDRFLVFGP